MIAFLRGKKQTSSGWLPVQSSSRKKMGRSPDRRCRAFWWCKALVYSCSKKNRPKFSVACVCVCVSPYSLVVKKKSPYSFVACAPRTVLQKYLHSPLYAIRRSRDFQSIKQRSSQHRSCLSLPRAVWQIKNGTEAPPPHKIRSPPPLCSLVMCPRTILQ